MTTPEKIDDFSEAQKKANITKSSNVRWAGVGATTTNNDGNTRTGDAGARVSGNESYHESQTQNIIGIDPDGNQFNVQTVNVQRNLPYLVSISAQNGYSPAYSQVVVGYDTDSNNIYVPFI